MEKNKQQTDIITDNFVSDIRTIIEQGRKQAYAATGQIAIMTYWNIGRRIVEEEQQGASRAAYGQKLIPALAVRLAAEYGTGYGKRNLAYYIIRKSKFPQNPKRSVRFSGKRTKRSVQKRKARNTQKAETKVL